MYPTASFAATFAIGYPVAFDASADEREGGVEAGLAAHGGEERVGAFLLDDLGDDLRGDRLDVGGVRELRIGHDRRGIGVHQDDPVPLLAQRLARLSAGVIELARLSNDDGAGTLSLIHI